MSNEFLEQYRDFVDGVTSQASRDIDEYLESVKRLKNQGCDISRLDTAFTGMCSEAGEANDLIKKLKFHGKDWSPEIEEHLTKELGDIMWYWMQACIGLGIDPEDAIQKNIEKLQSRYPGGKFSIKHSENRKKGDV